MTQLVRFARASLTLGGRAIGSGIADSPRRLCRACFVVAARYRLERISALARGSCYGDCARSSYASGHGQPAGALGASLAFLGFLFKKKPEEGEEPELIKTLKWAVLLIQREEYKKAEQMLHLALRQAQTVENEEAVTYVYDVMANLAFQVGEYEKAQKLYTSVMQRLLSSGTPKDDLKIVTLSLKMAKILEHNGDYHNAESGYQYCLNILEKHVNQETEDLDIVTIYAMNLDWYAHLLLTVSRYTEAAKFMEKAYELCVKLNGETHEQCVVLLNDLGSISFMRENLEDAIYYLNKAAEIGEKLPDMEDIPSIHINLGNVYMKKGLLDEAKKSCSKGWKLSKSKKNDESLQEAKLCLDEVKKLMSK